MKTLAKETAVFVPITVLWVFRWCFPLNWKEVNLWELIYKHFSKAEGCPCRNFHTLCKLSRDEKTDLPNVKGEVKRVIKATFAHLCTTLTRDKCLPLPAVKGESSGDKGRFCHAFNPYLWRASKVYFISICTPIKGVVKYVWDSGQRCDKSAVKLCLWLKSKACEKCRQMCLSLRSNVWQSCRQMRLRFKAKV